MSDWKPNLRPTGIGTLPLADPVKGVDLVLDYLPEMPFWPQLSARSDWEDMMIQFTSGLPCLRVEPAGRRALLDESLDRAEALTVFYETALGEDTAPFALTRETAPGFFELVDRAGRDPGRILRLKGHVTGPVTFSLAAKDQTGRELIHDSELLDAFALGLGLAGAWQVEHMPGLAEEPLIFIDEPAMTGFGSAFMALDFQTAQNALNATAGPIRRAGALAGIHVCGNTDWSLPLTSDLDVINFDAFGFGREFTLYPKQIAAFLERGGVLAWGLIPTAAYTGLETADQLAGHLEGLLDDLAAQGLNRTQVREQSILTPSCGMGALAPDQAFAILDLLRDTTALLRGK